MPVFASKFNEEEHDNDKTDEYYQNAEERVTPLND